LDSLVPWLWRGLVLVAVVGLPARAAEPLHARIDALVDARLTVPAAGPAADDEFLRRVYLDLTGSIPTAAQARAFLDDKAPDKRTKLIDALLASPEFPRRMADAWTLMLMERRTGDDANSLEWHEYLRASFEAGKPLDQLAREILSPDAEDAKTRASALFITKRLEQVGQNPVDHPRLTRDIGRLLLGMDLQCAQCHNHLTIKQYKQDDFQGLYTFVGHTYIRRDMKFPAVGEKLVDKKTEFTSVFAVTPKQTGPRVPGDAAQVEIPAFPKGQEYAKPPDRKANFQGEPKFSPVKALGERLPKTELFARNIANRLWFLAMGRGIVHPLDLHHDANPPSHPELLDLLSAELKGMKYDAKALLREVMLTKAYQRSSVVPSQAKGDVPESQYAVAPLRRMSAEQLATSVLVATGELERVTLAKAAPKVEKKIDPNADVNDDEKGLANKTTGPVTLKDARKKFVVAFAGPVGEAEVDFTPSLAAALFVSNSEMILDWLKAREGNLVARLATLGDAAAVAEELYLSVLTRRPTDEERTEVAAYLDKNKARRDAAIGELAWALIASTEFCVNH